MSRSSFSKFGDMQSSALQAIANTSKTGKLGEHHHHYHQQQQQQYSWRSNKHFDQQLKSITNGSDRKSVVTKMQENK